MPMSKKDACATIMVEVTELRKVFSTESGEMLEALGGVSFKCNKGEFLCVLGPTGCGKTTLLRLIAGLDEPTGGIIKIDGQEYSSPNPKATLVFQQYSLFPWRNVLDNVAFGLEVRGVQKKKRYEIARKFLSLVELSGFEKSYPYELSGGMQQRVAIARALANNADILLMDEPFGALDERTRHRLQEELLSIWEHEEKTIIFVTHNIDEAVFMADRILIMTDRPGRILEEIKITLGLSSLRIETLKRPRDRLSEDFTKYYMRIRLLFEKSLVSRR